jgi:hypothetical protein
MEYAARRYQPEMHRRLMQRALHAHYIDMYGGDEGDFESDYRIWRDSVRDVEEMIDKLLTFLPPALVVNGRTIDVRESLRRPDEVRLTHDPIKLIALARTGGFGSVEWVRHCARIKLYLVQLFYDFRKRGFAPADIMEEAAGVERRIIDRLFVRGSHRHVRVVAELDPENAYECLTYRMIDRMDADAVAGDNRFVIDANRFVIRGGARDIEVLFFLRGKEFVPLKCLVKNIRPPELASIGDRVAVRLLFKDERDLKDAIERVREVLASRPGCVSDQDMTLLPNARPTHPKNAASSPSFRAVRYNFRFMGVLCELQLMSIKGHIDANCRHDEAHHRCYKLRQYSVSVFPFLFPTRFTGISWPTFRREEDRVLALTHADVYKQIALHVRSKPNGHTH